MIYQRFENNPDEEFDYWLTEKLGWTSVAAMRRGMSMAEWSGWQIFYARRNQRRELARLQAGG